MNQKAEHIAALVDFVCLVYHEARNVRHPIDKGRLAREPRYAHVLNLARNKCKAWTQMEGVRVQAHDAVSAADAASCFQKTYGLSLAGC